MSKIVQVANISYKDVLHEWRMTLCVMFAVAAIATPLLLFFGLKSGVMDTLEHRLLDNPATMELLSVNDKKLEPEWFELQRKDPKVAFVIPRTRRLAASAEFVVKGKKLKKSLDLHPSGPGDPLLAHYKALSPQYDEAVLSAEAARRIDARVGDTMTATISRDLGKVKVSRDFKVSAILPDEAGVIASAYIDLPSLEQIEAFKDGMAVPELNWPGSDNIAKAMTPSALLVMDEPLDAVRESMLIQNTGFVKLSRFDKACDDAGNPVAIADRPNHPFISCDKLIYQLFSIGSPASSSDLAALADRIRGRNDAFVMPYNPFLSAEIGDLSLNLLPLSALNRSVDPRISCDDHLCDFNNKIPQRLLAVSEKNAAALGSELQEVKINFYEVNARGEVTDRSLNFKVKFVALPGLSDDTALVNIALLGQLGTLQLRDLMQSKTSDGQDAFMLKRRGYTGFRMYASSLDNVMALQEQLASEDLKTVSRADRIAEVMSLDYYLGMLFWLIASASLAGAACCLVANMYASIERKRKELAILRLLGVHGGALCVYPLCCSLLLTIGGIVISLVVFFILAHVVNSSFAQQLQADEKFCDLSFYHLCMTVLIAVAIASVSGLAASRRVMKIEPSESLRDE